MDLLTKFQPNRTIYAKVIPFDRISAGRLVKNEKKINTGYPNHKTYHEF